jgi:hypothetical protein
MKKTRAWIERFLYSAAYPFLFSIYFVLRMYEPNAHGIPFKDLIRPLFISVLVTTAFFLLFLRLVHRPQTAALMTTVLVLAFYLYTITWTVLPLRRWMPARSFAILWPLAAVLLISLLAWRMRGQPSRDLIAGMNMMAFILLMFPVVQLSVNAITWHLIPAPKVSHAIDRDASAGAPADAPDIYYIILDAYPRADVLQKTYGYDNTPFLQSLKDLGFYVAECSQSNYSITGLSLTSSLNMDYLQNLSDSFRPDTGEFQTLFKYLNENAVKESVTNMGYKTVAFASGFPWVGWRDADLYIAPPDGPMTEFEGLLLQSTYAHILDNTPIVDYDDRYAERFRVRTRLVLGSFDRLASEPGPKFVFIHLVLPHPPYAFDENGNPVPASQADPVKGYLDQVKFANRAILPGLKTLIEKSKTPPVIILQGDHGPLLKDDLPAEVKNLNAYYLPKGSEQLYPTISPVNSFRIVFNTYFGTQLPLLEDVNYFSDRYKRYDFTAIPNDCTP